MPYFLKQDIELLEKRIQETIEQLKETGAELRTAVTQSSETWHDNFGFENAQQQARLLGQRLNDLEYIRRNATILEKPSSNKTVAIGHTVVATDLKTNKTNIYRIGSHITFTKDTISYDSPIGSILLNKKVGQRAKGIAGGKEKEFKIVQIIADQKQP